MRAVSRPTPCGMGRGGCDPAKLLPDGRSVAGFRAVSGRESARILIGVALCGATLLIEDALRTLSDFVVAQGRSGS